MQRNTLYKIDDPTFIEAVKTSKSIHEALLKCGMNACGGAYPIFRRRCKKLNIEVPNTASEKQRRASVTFEEVCRSCSTNISRSSALAGLNLDPTINSNIQWIMKIILLSHIDISHWLGQAHLKDKTHNWGKAIPLEEILVPDSSYPTTELKRRLLKAKLLVYKCYTPECNLQEWLGKGISLQLDHINGDHSDHRLENLRLLCPNCHSQTNTFCRRKDCDNTSMPLVRYNLLKIGRPENLIGVEKPIKNKTSTYIKTNTCIDCKKNISSQSIRCKRCAGLASGKTKTKIKWPDNSALIELVDNTNYSQAAKILGVSDNAIRHRLKRRNLI